MGKLGQLLVARGWITVQQLTRALKNQSAVGGRLGTCLLEMEALSEDLLLKGLAEQFGIRGATAENLRGIPDEVRSLLSPKLAVRCRAVPFQILGGSLEVAMADPRNLACQDEIAFATGKRVKVYVALEARILESLDQYYGEDCPSRYANLIDRLNRSRYLWQREGATPAPSHPEPAAEALPPISPTSSLGRPSISQRSPIPTSATMTPSFAPLGPDNLAPQIRFELPPLPEPALPPTPPATAATPRPPAPPPPPPVRSIALTAEEKLTLHEPAEPETPAPAPVPVKAEPPPPAPAPPLPTFEAVQAAFATTVDRDEIGRLLLAFLQRRYRRVALFQIHRQEAAGWMAAGEGVEAGSFSRFTINFDQPSVFLNLRQGNAVYFGPLPPMPVHRQLVQLWGGELPRDCAVLPVSLKGRLVTVIYAEGAAEGGGSVPSQSALSLEDWRRLTEATAAAFERCILHRKQARSEAP